MFKLIKYEYRKNRTLLLTILGIIAVLEVYFLVSAHLAQKYAMIDMFSETTQRAEVNLAVSISLLVAASFGTALAVFIMGVAGYSRELNQRTSYLIFMTPQSTLSMPRMAARKRLSRRKAARREGVSEINPTP